MGYGSWDSADYSAKATLKATRGVSAFTYNDDVISKVPYADRKVHDKLNPNGVIRESRDSDAHPESNAVAVFFDVTGSMGHIPRILQQKLPALMDTLLRRSLLEHPQILFGAIGDATCDKVPLQVGQFEADINMDEDLSNMYLEGGGGGQHTESYELAMYFAANKMVCDCFEKRGKRGYLFIIADELFYPSVKRTEVLSVIGDSIQDNIPTEEIVRTLQEKWDVYILMPERHGAHIGDKNIKPGWTNLFGQNVIMFDHDHVSEVIAGIIGAAEGHDESVIHDALDSVGSSSAKASVSRSISTVTANSKSVAVVGTVPGTRKGSLV